MKLQYVIQYTALSDSTGQTGNRQDAGSAARSRSSQRIRGICAALFALLGLLSACGTPGGAVPTATSLPSAPTATGIPTATPTATSIPTATPLPEPTATPFLPTETPAAGGMLPMPLYLIANSLQIVRVETDGATVTTLTDESAQIIEFDVAPNGALLYTIAGEQSRTLIYRAADGSDRRELLRGDLQSPIWQPNGAFYAVAWRDGVDGSGIYTGAAEGRRPIRLLADLPHDPANMQNPGLIYVPDRWSPDGRLLLARTYPYYGPDAPGGDIGSQGMAVVREDGSVLTVSPGAERACYTAAWSADSSQVYCSAYMVEPPAVWRMDITTGMVEGILPDTDETEPYDGFSMQAVCDGSLYVIAGPSSVYANYRILHVSKEAFYATVVRQEGLDPYAAALALWAPNGAGVVTAASTPTEGGLGLQWIPASDQQATQLPVAAGSGILRWGADTNPCR